jgi:hypothetical protein
MLPCDEIMKLLAPAFKAWNHGLDGGGLIYEAPSRVDCDEETASTNLQRIQPNEEAFLRGEANYTDPEHPMVHTLCNWNHTARPSTEDVMAAVEAGTSQYPLGEAFSIGSWMKDTPGWDTFINAHEVNVSAIDGTQLRYVFKAFTRRQKAVDGFMEKNMVCYMHVRGDVEKLSQRECCVIKKGWSIKSTKARKWRHQTRKTLLF